MMQTCFNCEKTGNWNSPQCNGCKGSGVIPSTLFMCFNCQNVQSWNSPHCNGCHGKGFINNSLVIACFNCVNSNSWNSPHCNGCHGKGFIQSLPYIYPCFNCTHLKSWNSPHCNGCKGKGYLTTFNVISCFNCSHTSSWNSPHCNGCHGKGFIQFLQDIYPCFNCTHLKSWNSPHCNGCKGKGYINTPNTIACHNCSNAKVWNSPHCRGCNGKGYISGDTYPCPVCQKTNNWNSVHCNSCNGCGFRKGTLVNNASSMSRLPIYQHENKPEQIYQYGNVYEIQPSTLEYKTVELFFKRSQEVNTPCTITFHLSSILRIYNPLLEGTYQPSIYEMSLFHGTSKEACYSIAKLGFNKSGMLGAGMTIFAPNPNKTKMCSDNHMLLCRVNLQESAYAKKAVLQEYCINDVEQVVPLYILEIK